MFPGNSSKNLVLKTLFFEWPLTAKEIYSRVSKNLNKDVSYQAIHKMINSLLEEGVLAKQDNKYVVSLDWVKQNKELLTRLETNLVEGSVVSPLEQKIIYYYYYVELTMGDIGEKLKISESRISQIHSKLLDRLKDKIIRNPDFFSEEIRRYKKKND